MIAIQEPLGRERGLDVEEHSQADKRDVARPLRLPDLPDLWPGEYHVHEARHEHVEDPGIRVENVFAHEASGGKGVGGRFEWRYGM